MSRHLKIRPIGILVGLAAVLVFALAPTAASASPLGTRTARHAQRLAHIGQGRQHNVDGQRVHRHECSDKGNEFGAGQGPRRKRLICHLLSETRRRPDWRTMLP